MGTASAKALGQEHECSRRGPGWLEQSEPRESRAGWCLLSILQGVWDMVNVPQIVAAVLNYLQLIMSF